MSHKPAPNHRQDFALVLGHIQPTRQRIVAQADASITSLSDKNLWRMKQFLKTDPWAEKPSTTLREIHPGIGKAFKDRDVKKPHENPSIGVLLCRDKDDEVVEYALSHNLSPALVAPYERQLPNKKQMAAKLHELLALHEGVSDA